MATSVPAKIGKYDIAGVIGRGGMGIVYKATDPHLGRPVAIKMMTGAFSENPDMLKRFYREAQSLGSLQHPNIVTVYDLGDYSGNPYLVMQYLEGEGLDVMLSNRRQLSLLEKITVIVQVCHGLSYAHRHGVVHRDIKPANIMLAKDGGVKIFDFGIAHVRHQNVTRTGQVVGTLSYMAPEQVNAEPIDARTDLFSTGVVLYQLFTNHLPFEGENTATTLLKIVHEPPPPLGNFLPNYPPEMEQILLRALAKKPDERYGSADEFALDLAQLQGQLKQELISQEMQEVALFLDRGEVYKAQDSLLRVLKIDQHQTNATRLLREVQQRIQREEIGNQVRGLRESAQDALSHDQFENALELVERALGLERDHAGLQELRESIRAASARAEQLHNALQVAEAAQAEGKLDEAKRAAEEALEVAPDDAQAKTVHRAICRDITERSRQRQMEGYLFEARQEISTRKFTAALEILKHAEALDPVAPQVHALIESAVAGREQERRRRELEALTHEVENALNRDDYRSACQKSDEALAKFPEERNLLKLKALADRQRQIEERKQFIDEHLATARKFLQEGRNQELQESLEKAILKVGPEPRLQSLMAVVRENVQRDLLEQRKISCLRKAKASLQGHAFDDAIHGLEDMAKEVGEDVEIQDLLARARREKADDVQGALWRAEHESVLDLRVNILEEALRNSPQEGELKEHLHNARDLNQFIATVAQQAHALEKEQRYDQALAKWEALRSAYRHYPGLEDNLTRVRNLRDQAHTSAARNWIEQIENALQTSDPKRAVTLVELAVQEFPWDSDLLELRERAEVAIRLRAKAQKMLADGRKSFGKQRWEQGAEDIVRACQVATLDSVIRLQAVNELTQASRDAMEKNWRDAEAVLRRLSEIDPSAAASPELCAKIQERKREAAITGALEATKKKQAAGDFAGALRELAQTLGLYPDEPRLRGLQSALQERLPPAGEPTRNEKERQEKRDFVRDAHAHEKTLPPTMEQSGAQSPPAIAGERGAEAPPPVAPQVATWADSPFAAPTAMNTGLARPSANLSDPMPPTAESLLGLPPHPAPGANWAPTETLRPTGVEATRESARPETRGPTPAGDALQPTSLPVVERHLATFIGPLAKLLVKRAANKTTSTQELYTILAASLEKETDRKAFLARRLELAPDQAELRSAIVSPPQTAPAPSDASSKEEITSAASELAGRKLATYLGPIAQILARKEAKRAANLRNLHLRLADHVENQVQRARFLADMGVKDLPVTPPVLDDPGAAVDPAKHRETGPTLPVAQVAPLEPGDESEDPESERRAS